MELNEIRKELSGLDRFPQYRALAKRIAREDYRLFLDGCDMYNFKEKILYGYTLGYAKDDISSLLYYFEGFIPYVDDWAVCDTFCQSFKITRKYQSEVYELLMKYKDSKKEFESRVVSVTLLSHYLVDDYIDRVIDALDKLDDSEYYSMMGTAWALATVMAKYPEKCREYMEGEVKISDQTFNKALQKMRESFRVSDEIKQWTRTVKK